MHNLETTVNSALETGIRSLSFAPRATVNLNITAVVTVEADARYVGETLSAILGQSVIPSLVLIVQVGPQARPWSQTLEVPALELVDGTSARQSVTVQSVTLRNATSFGHAVSQGISHANLRSSTTHLWLFHDDSRPTSPHDLETLLETDRNAPGARLIGVKQVGWDGQGLHDVGYFVTKNHRRASLVVDGEEDQEQYNDRQDVYGVSLAGALVALPTWMNLSGTDPWYSSFGESLDFARRVYRTGGRVVVSPSVSIAHARSRFEGLRTRDGKPLEEEQRVSSYTAAVTARDKFAGSEIPVWKKPFVWLWRVITAIGVFIARLFSKKPGEAVCELLAPWRALFRFPQALAARSRLRALPSAHRTQTSGLVASPEQVHEWKQRKKVLNAQRHRVIYSPLEIENLRRLSHRRALWIGVLIVVGLAGGVLMNWQGLAALFSGVSLTSAILAPTAAHLPDIAVSSTSMWSQSLGLGAPAAPLPFSLVLVVISLLGGGNLALGVSLFFLASPALILLSFWGLAGVFTRSSALRFTTACLWGVMPLVLGLYQVAHLPMLVVFTLLPLSFTLVFKAVGMYAVDAPKRAHSSVQSAAIAGLVMAGVALSEPQLIVPYVLIFAVFFAFVRSHRAMLLLMPVPAIVVLAPTFFSTLVHLNQGLWRQFFVDATLPDVTTTGAPSSHGFLTLLGSVVARNLGRVDSTVLVVISWVLMAAIAVVLVGAIAALVIPRVLRVSRMAWIVAASGGLLALLAPRITVGLDGSAPVAASILPAVSVLFLGLLMAFTALGAQAVAPAPASSAAPQARVAVAPKVLRGLLSGAVIVAVAAGTTLAAASWSQAATVHHMTSEGLPLVATQDLAKHEGARILALSADSSQSVSYEVMRTRAGDLIDRNATTQILDLTSENAQETQLRNLAARLLTANDDAAITSLGDMGFTGIFVPASPTAARASLAAHVMASTGAEVLVNNDSGLYVRFSVPKDGSIRHIDTSGQEQAQRDPLRITWLVILSLVVLTYLIVAIPRTRRLEQEED